LAPLRIPSTTLETQARLASTQWHRFHRMRRLLVHSLCRPCRATCSPPGRWPRGFGFPGPPSTGSSKAARCGRSGSRTPSGSRRGAPTGALAFAEADEWRHAMTWRTPTLFVGSCICPARPPTCVSQPSFTPSKGVGATPSTAPSACGSSAPLPRRWKPPFAARPPRDDSRFRTAASASSSLPNIGVPALPRRIHALEEFLGTKLRALYQRTKGRDLFDLATTL
jgi:hypothetical protein